MGAITQYEAQQPPVYYAVTVPMRFVAVDVFGMGDVGGTRATGIVWLCAGLLAMWMAGRVVGLRPLAIGAAVLLLGSAPLVVYQEASISNDAASIFAGASVFLLAALAWRHPGGWVVPVLAAAGFVAVAIDQSNGFAVVVASVRVRVAQHLPGRRIGPRCLRGDAHLPPRLVAGRRCAVARRPGIGVGLARHQPGSRHRQPQVVSGVRRLAHGSSRVRGDRQGSGAHARSCHGLVQRVPTHTLECRSQPRTRRQRGAADAVARRRAGGAVRPSTALVPLDGAVERGGAVLSAAWCSAVGLLFGYDIDPSLTGRYGMSLAPLLALGLVAAIRGRAVLGVLWAVALATFTTTLCFTLVG